MTNVEILLEAKKAVNKIFADIPIENYAELKEETTAIMQESLKAVIAKDVKAEDEFKLALRGVTHRIERKKRDIYFDRLLSLFFEYGFKILIACA